MVTEAIDTARTFSSDIISEASFRFCEWNAVSTILPEPTAKRQFSTNRTNWLPAFRIAPGVSERVNERSRAKSNLELLAPNQRSERQMATSHLGMCGVIRSGSPTPMSRELKP